MAQARGLSRPTVCKNSHRAVARRSCGQSAAATRRGGSPKRKEPRQDCEAGEAQVGYGKWAVGSPTTRQLGMFAARQSKRGLGFCRAAQTQVPPGPH